MQRGDVFRVLGIPMYTQGIKIESVCFKIEMGNIEKASKECG